MFHRILFVMLMTLTLTISAAPKLHYPDGSTATLEKAVGYSAGFVANISTHGAIIEKMTYHGKTMILFKGESGSFPVYTAGKFPLLVDKTLFWRGDKDPQYIAKKYGVTLSEIMPEYNLYRFVITGEEDALHIADRIVTNKDGYAFPNLVYRQVLNYLPDYPIADEYYAHQWHLSNGGSYNDYYGDPIKTVEHADIHFDAAMDYIVTQALDIDETTKIAIMDSGVVLDHEDLTEIEIGYDAIEDKDGGQPDLSNIDSLSQGDIGGLAHGTSCAGISAAVGNSKGMSGVCPWCGIYPVRYLDPVNNSYVDDEKTLRTFKKYAEDKSITAVNCSFGPTAEYGDVPVSSGQIEAHKYFMEHGRDGKGGVIVYASGNDNIDAGYNKLMDYRFSFERDGKSVTNKLVVVSATTAWDTKV
ncbi:S8 family serine peptidase, partial [bacterium]|nr:S8 family serine peptidase [bacterium]